MSDDRRLMDERIEEEDVRIERELNPDMALLSDYMAGELPPERAAEVRERLDHDPEFRELAEPVLVAWTAPSLTRPLAHDDLVRSWLELRERVGMPRIDPEVAPASTVPAVPPRERERGRHGAFMRVAIAATLLIALALAPFVGSWTGGASPRVVRTPGNRAEVVMLPDASRITVGPSSRIEYPPEFPAVRQVALEGEARFDVWPARVPFIVTTRLATVTVTGTSFSVHAFGDEVAMVTVHEGSVRVRTRHGTLAGARVVTAGQRALITRHRGLEVLK